MIKSKIRQGFKKPQVIASNNWNFDIFKFAGIECYQETGKAMLLSDGEINKWIPKKFIRSYDKHQGVLELERWTISKLRN